VVITAVTDDTGTSNSDFITSDRGVKISGSVAQFTDTGNSAGDSVLVQIFNSAGELKAQEYVRPNNGTWQMSADTPDLVDGTYTVKAAIVDAAGNVVKTAADQTLVVSQTYLQAVADTATAQEAGVDANGAAIETINPTGNVLANDVDVNTTGRSVTKVVFGGATHTVPTGSTSEAGGLTIQGAYGTLTIGADGSYKYTVDDALAQPLKNTPAVETFTYEASNSAGTLRSAELKVTVNGANDAASFDATDTTTGTVPAGSRGTVSGQLKVIDPDEGDATILASTNLNRSYGTFAFSTSGNITTWTYTPDTTKTVTHGATATDSIVVQSHDGTASQTITVTLTGTNSSPELDAGTSAIDSVNGNNSAPTNSDTSQLPAGATKLKDLVSGSDSDNDLLGVAITSVDTTHGKLWYTTNHGQQWHEVPAETSLTKAFLLNAQSDDTWVYYQQTSAGVNHAFKFVAWDQTAGQVGGALDASNRGDGSAFSTGLRPVVVDDVYNVSSTNALLINASTGTDTIRLIDSGMALDLTSTNIVRGVEKIDLTGTGNNTVKLNWNSLMQADQQQLTIDGDAGDGVQFVVGGNTSVVRDATSNTSYDIYHVTRNYAGVDTTHDLWVAKAVALSYL
jgi:VCBS repeat-containing protein